MSRFANLFRGRLAAAHASHFARSVSVTLPGEAEFSTLAVVHKTRIHTRSSEDGTKTVATCRIRLTDLESIRHDATVTIDGYAWSISDTSPSDQPGVELMLERTLLSEPSRSNYRR